MLSTIEKIPGAESLENPEQRAIIDRILEENKDLPGSTMVVLNSLQEAIGLHFSCHAGLCC